jgi:hypothetical protein
MCPAFIEPRWLCHDRILGFLFHHANAVNKLSGDRNHVTRTLSESQQLLSILYELMVTVESSYASLARAQPLIVEAVTKVVNSAKQCCEPGTSDIYLAAARRVRKYLLESTLDLPQLASVLTLAWSNEAGSQLVAMRRTSHLGPMRLPDDEEISRTREPSVELELFEFEDQPATHEEEEEEEEILEGEEKDEEEGELEWLPIPRLPGAIIPLVASGWDQLGLRARISLDPIGD